MSRLGIMRLFAVAAVAGLAWGSSVYGATKPVLTEHFVIVHEGISDRTVAFVERDAEQALRDVTAYLGRNYRGPKITILIKAVSKFEYPKSTSPDATIKIPASRLSLKGAQDGPVALRGRAMGFWHSVTSIVAPSGHAARDLKRFLTDGLGGCMQEKFGGKAPTPWPAKFFPTMGKELHGATAELAAEIGLLPLAKAIRKVSERKLTRSRRLGWLEAASFVCFLLDTRARDSFLQWYSGAAFDKAYGVGFGDMEREWVGFIRSVDPAHRGNRSSPSLQPTIGSSRHDG